MKPVDPKFTYDYTVKLWMFCFVMILFAVLGTGLIINSLVQWLSQYLTRTGVIFWGTLACLLIFMAFYRKRRSVQKKGATVSMWRLKMPVIYHHH